MQTMSSKECSYVMILKSIRTIAVVVLAMVGVNAYSQDLLASQAPVDKKMKAIDSVALQRQIQKEKMEYPGFALYPSWITDHVHVYNDVTLPDSFTIDLKGFCMPTTNNKVTSR